MNSGAGLQCHLSYIYRALLCPGSGSLQLKGLLWLHFGNLGFTAEPRAGSAAVPAPRCWVLTVCPCRDLFPFPPAQLRAGCPLCPARTLKQGSGSSPGLPHVSVPFQTRSWQVFDVVSASSDVFCLSDSLCFPSPAH